MLLISTKGNKKEKKMSEKEFGKMMDRIYGSIFKKSQLLCIGEDLKIVPIYKMSKKKGR